MLVEQLLTAWKLSTDTLMEGMHLIVSQKSILHFSAKVPSIHFLMNRVDNYYYGGNLSGDYVSQTYLTRAHLPNYILLDILSGGFKEN